MPFNRVRGSSNSGTTVTGGEALETLARSGAAAVKGVVRGAFGSVLTVCFSQDRWAW